MGAWGHRSFENDGALDWLADLQVQGVRLIRRTLAGVARAKAKGWIDVDDAQAAIAAAEVIAAARGRPARGCPAEVTEWIASRRGALGPSYSPLARRAVEQVRDRSELQELWEGSSRGWRRAIANLLERLVAKPRTRKVPDRKQSATPRAKEKRALCQRVSSPDGSLRAVAVSDGAAQSTLWIESRDVSCPPVRHTLSISLPFDQLGIRWMSRFRLAITVPGPVSASDVERALEVDGRKIRIDFKSRSVRSSMRAGRTRGR